MEPFPETTNGETPALGESFVFPSYGNVGPLYIATLSLLGLTIGLPVWFFSTPVISNVASASDVSTPPTHQPHVNLSPSSPIRSPSISPSSPSEISKVSNQVDKKKKKQKEKKKKNQKGTKPLTTLDVGSKQPAIVNRTRSVGEVNKIKTKNLKPKFPCSLCKGDHFLRDFPGLPKVLEMWSSMSSVPVRHDGDAPSTSDVKFGKKNTIVKFPCMLCKGDHYSHLCPRMDEASSLLENLRLPTCYRKIPPNPSLVDGMVNLVPSPVSLVDQVVNLVSSLVEPLTKLVDPIPSSVNHTLHLKGDPKVVYLVSPLVIPTLHLKSEPKLVNSVPPSIDPTSPLKSETKVVNSVPPPIDPNPHSKSEDVTQVYLVNIDSPRQGGTTPILRAPPSSNQMISIDWNQLTEPRLPSYMPFQITM
jgi:hypothetical protein